VSTGPTTLGARLDWSSLRQTTSTLEAQGLPDVVAAIDEGVWVELDREGASAGFSPEHAVEHRKLAAGSRDRFRRSVSPHLTDAALKGEVSDGVTDGRAADMHRSGFLRRRHERAEVDLGVCEGIGVGSDLGRDQAEGTANVALVVEAHGRAHDPVGIEQERAERSVLD
jgi:hypothetical protein